MDIGYRDNFFHSLRRIVVCCSWLSLFVSKDKIVKIWHIRNVYYINSFADSLKTKLNFVIVYHFIVPIFTKKP